MTGQVPVFQLANWWTLVTAIYLHGNLLHIFFNLMWIRQLGPVVEDLYGAGRFFLIFTISGVFGFLISSLFNPATVGASGSIFGLLGAVIFYGRDRGGAFGQDLYRQMLNWAIVLFIFGFIWPNVDNYAHGGGFVAGYVSAMLLQYQEKASEKFIHRAIALGVVALTALAFITNITWFLFNA